MGSRFDTDLLVLPRRPSAARLHSLTGTGKHVHLLDYQLFKVLTHFKIQIYILLYSNMQTISVVCESVKCTVELLYSTVKLTKDLLDLAALIAL